MERLPSKANLSGPTLAYKLMNWTSPCGSYLLPPSWVSMKKGEAGKLRALVAELLCKSFDLQSQHPNPWVCPIWDHAHQRLTVGPFEEPIIPQRHAFCWQQELMPLPWSRNVETTNEGRDKSNFDLSTLLKAKWTEIVIAWTPGSTASPSRQIYFTYSTTT